MVSRVVSIEGVPAEYSATKFSWNSTLLPGRRHAIGCFRALGSRAQGFSYHCSILRGHSPGLEIHGLQSRSRWTGCRHALVHTNRWRELTLLTGDYYDLVQLGRFMAAAVCKVGIKVTQEQNGMSGFQLPPLFLIDV
jgi:hypothetical protein